MKPVEPVRPPAGGRDRVWRLWPSAIQSRMTLRGFALRCALAAAVLVPAAGLTFMLGEPFAISAIASTTAIVLHAPLRYRQRPRRIFVCYAAGTAVSAPISLLGAIVGAPALLAATISAVIIVASPLGRVHPPTACIPLAITAPSIQPLALLGRWLSFTGLALACLAVLWLLTTQPRARRGHITTDHTGTPCGTTS